MTPIEIDVLVFKEDDQFVAFCPELDISSCGDSIEHSKEMLVKAARLFIEESEKMGTLEDILAEAGYRKKMNGKWVRPEIVDTDVAVVS